MPTSYRRVLFVLLLLAILFSMLACVSTACMSDQELIEFLEGATPVACW